MCEGHYGHRYEHAPRPNEETHDKFPSLHYFLSHFPVLQFFVLILTTFVGGLVSQKYLPCLENLKRRNSTGESLV